MIRGDWGAALAFAARIAIVLGINALGAAVPVPSRAHPDERFVAEEVDRLVAADPTNAQLLLDQSRIRQRARDFDGALVSLARALALGADADAVAAARASVYLDAGFPRMAIFECDTVLAHSPEQFGVLFERGRALLAIGEAEAADRDFGRAIVGMATPRPEHVVLRAETLHARGRPADAVEALDEGMQRLGLIPSLALLAVDLEVEQQRYDRALARLDALMRQTPTNTAWIVRRADILARADRPAEARAERARALQQLETRPGLRQSAASRALAERLRNELAASSSEQGG